MENIYTTCETYTIYLYVFIHRPNIVCEHVLLCVHNKSVQSLHWDLSDTINYNILTYNHQSERLSYSRQQRLKISQFSEFIIYYYMTIAYCL